MSNPRAKLVTGYRPHLAKVPLEPDGDLRQYLELLMKVSGQHAPVKDFHFQSTAEMLLRIGFSSKERYTGHVHLKPKYCFRNSWLTANLYDLFYVEGMAITKGVGIPMEHAWCLDENGVVFDPTWDDGESYWGVPIDRRFLSRQMFDSEIFGLIGNHKAHWPLLSQDPLEYVAVPFRERTKHELQIHDDALSRSKAG